MFYSTCTTLFFIVYQFKCQNPFLEFFMIIMATLVTPGKNKMGTSIGCVLAQYHLNERNTHTHTLNTLNVK